MKCVKHPGPAKVHMLIHQFRVSFCFLPLIVRVVVHVSFLCFMWTEEILFPNRLFNSYNSKPTWCRRYIPYIVAVPLLSGLYKIVSLALARTCLLSFVFCLFRLVYFCDNADAQYFSFSNVHMNEKLFSLLDLDSRLSPSWVNELLFVS